MRIEQLVYLLDVAKTGSLNLSAERLFVVQSTISEAIQKLEEEMGVPLLVRFPKGVTLTASGQVAVEWANQILADFSEMRMDVLAAYKPLVSDLNGTLCIGTSSFINQFVFQEMVDDFRGVFPSVCVTDYYTRHYEVVSFLEKGLIDLAVLEFFDIPGAPKTNFKQNVFSQTECLKFYEEPLWVVAARNFSIGKGKTVGMKELVEQPLVMMWSYMEEDSEFLKNLQRFGEVQIALRTDTVQVARQAVMDGRGIGLITPSVYRKMFLPDLSASRQIRLLKIREQAVIQYYLSWLKEKPLSTVAQTFVEQVRHRSGC